MATTTMLSEYIQIARPDQPKPSLIKRLMRWVDQKLQKLGDAVPEWAACCGSSVMWDMVDAELDFQHLVRVEQQYVYGTGSVDSLDVLLSVHPEAGYSLRPQDATPGQGGDAAQAADVDNVECRESQPETTVAVSEAQQCGEETRVACEGVTEPHELATATCAEATSSKTGLVPVEMPIGKREWRRRQAVVSAPIVAKVVAEMRAEIGYCCVTCGHQNIDSVRRDCTANYQAAQWVAMRVMKQRKLHREHINLYLLPCLVAYFARVQHADGLGGYQGDLGYGERRVWRRRHRQI